MDGFEGRGDVFARFMDLSVLVHGQVHEGHASFDQRFNALSASGRQSETDTHNSLGESFSRCFPQRERLLDGIRFHFRQLAVLQPGLSELAGVLNEGDQVGIECRQVFLPVFNREDGEVTQFGSCFGNGQQDAAAGQRYRQAIEKDGDRTGDHVRRFRGQ